MGLRVDLLHTGLNVRSHHEYAGPVHSLIIGPFRRNLIRLREKVLLIFLTKPFGSFYNYFVCGCKRERKRNLLIAAFEQIFFPGSQVAAIWIML